MEINICKNCGSKLIYSGYHNEDLDYKKWKCPKCDIEPEKCDKCESAELKKKIIFWIIFIMIMILVGSLVFIGGFF